MSRPAQIPKTSRGLVAVNQPIAAGHSLRVMIALSSCRRRATSPQPDAWLPTSRTSGTSKGRWHQHLPEKVVPHREHAISTCACHPGAAPPERRIPERRRHMAQAEIATDVVGWVTWLAGAHAGPIGRKKTVYLYQHWNDFLTHVTKRSCREAVELRRRAPRHLDHRPGSLGTVSLGVAVHPELPVCIDTERALLAVAHLQASPKGQV